jgi:hypothetical protein
MLVREVYQDMAHWQLGLSALRTIIAQYSHAYVVVVFTTAMVNLENLLLIRTLLTTVASRRMTDLSQNPTIWSIGE